MKKYDVKNFIFSSTAATYGIPDVDMITEEARTNPINPYGRSKLMVEQVLSRLCSSLWLQLCRCCAISMLQARMQREKSVKIMTRNPFNSPHSAASIRKTRKHFCIWQRIMIPQDGTCIRDYIHVTDLAKAHILALWTHLLSGKIETAMYNLGNGLGYSC